MARSRSTTGSTSTSGAAASPAAPASRCARTAALRLYRAGDDGPGGDVGRRARPAVLLAAGGGLTVSGGEPLSQADVHARAAGRGQGACDLDTASTPAARAALRTSSRCCPSSTSCCSTTRRAGRSKHRQLTGSDGTRILQTWIGCCGAASGDPARPARARGERRAGAPRRDRRHRRRRRDRGGRGDAVPRARARQARAARPPRRPRLAGRDAEAGAALARWRSPSGAAPRASAAAAGSGAGSLRLSDARADRPVHILSAMESPLQVHAAPTPATLPTRPPDPCTLVLFGATGDLAQRKIVPGALQPRARRRAAVAVRARRHQHVGGRAAAYREQLCDAGRALLAHAAAGPGRLGRASRRRSRPSRPT